MHTEIQLFTDIVIIFILSAAVIFICHKIKVPPIVGYLITGIIAGPYGFELIRSYEEVEILAEIGIVLLLFAIGIEFSVKNILKIKYTVFIGGSLQIGITALVYFFVLQNFDFSPNEAIFGGFLVALSSTALVMKLIQESGELQSQQGQSSLALLIFQDIIVVPLILLVPIIAGTQANMTEAMMYFVLKVAGIIAVMILSMKWIMPGILFSIVKTRDKELFLITIVGLCFGVAWLTSSIGLSLALGAFIAGLIISESEYSNHAFGYILPFKEIFISFFFISIGMLLDISYFMQNIDLILLLVPLIILSKTILTATVILILGYPLNTAILTGISIGQIGEFSFILARLGEDFGLLTGDYFQLFMAVSILTMAATPLLTKYSHFIIGILNRIPMPLLLRTGFKKVKIVELKKIENHLVIIGYGLNGRNVSVAAKSTGIPYIIIDSNPQTVRDESEKGEPIFYGDAVQEKVLEHAFINSARVCVIAVPDPACVEKITENVKRLNPTIHLIVRTRYLSEMQKLYDLGADDVIPEEFETSIEIYTRVLSSFLIAREDIEGITNKIRSEGYRMFRSRSAEPSSTDYKELKIPDIDHCSFMIEKESNLAGKTLAQSQIKEKYNLVVIAIYRENNYISTPLAAERLFPGDKVYVIGNTSSIMDFNRDVKFACGTGD